MVPRDAEGETCDRHWSKHWNRGADGVPPGADGSPRPGHRTDRGQAAESKWQAEHSHMHAHGSAHTNEGRPISHHRYTHKYMCMQLPRHKRQMCTGLFTGMQTYSLWGSCTLRNHFPAGTRSARHVLHYLNLLGYVHISPYAQAPSAHTPSFHCSEISAPARSAHTRLQHRPCR